MCKFTSLKKIAFVFLLALISGLIEIPQISNIQEANAARKRREHRSDAADISFFYRQLSPYGDWVYVEPYGYCWTPYDVPRYWRPYYVGHWGWADECGWTWVSDCDCDQDWAWATYHYGRWLYDDDYGWMWVPGHHWGPAWVAWRQGDDYIGWAPLPPDVRWDEEHGSLSVREGPQSYNIDPYWWNFVEADHFIEPNIHEYVIPPARNYHIEQRTRNVTNYVMEHEIIANRSFGLHELGRVHDDRPAASVHLRQIDNIAEAPHGTISGGQGRQQEIPVFRHNIAPAPSESAPARVIERKTVSRPPLAAPVPGAVPPAGSIGGANQPVAPPPTQPSRPQAPRPAPQPPSVAPSAPKPAPAPPAVNPSQPKPPSPGGLTPPSPAPSAAAPGTGRTPKGPQNLGNDRMQKLEQQHTQEMQKPPTGISKEDLAKQQDTERKTQQEMQSKEDQVWQRRQQRMRGGSSSPPPSGTSTQAPAEPAKVPSAPAPGQPAPLPKPPSP